MKLNELLKVVDDDAVVQIREMTPSGRVYPDGLTGVYIDRSSLMWGIEDELNNYIVQNVTVNNPRGFNDIALCIEVFDTRGQTIPQ